MSHLYDVFCLVQKGNHSCIERECVTGKIFVDYLLERPQVEKEVFYEWVRQLAEYATMTETKHLTISPFHFILKDNRSLSLLDLQAYRNQSHLQNIKNSLLLQKFPLDHSIFSFGRTLQFVLIQSQIVPKLTHREISQLKTILRVSCSLIPVKRKKKYHVCCLGILLFLMFFLLMKQNVGRVEESVFTPNWTISDTEREESLGRLKAVLEHEGMTGEEKGRELTDLIRSCPSIVETERFQSLKREYGIDWEGDKLWLKR